MFALGSWVFNHDAEVMLIEPLNKTMNVLKKVGKLMYSATFSSGVEVYEGIVCRNVAVCLIDDSSSSS
jgi:hypothetical protein